MHAIFAYLDPGSGSLILQAILGGLAGLTVGAKLWGRRVMSTLMFWKRDAAVREPAEPSVDET